MDGLRVRLSGGRSVPRRSNRPTGGGLEGCRIAAENQPLLATVSLSQSCTFKLSSRRPGAGAGWLLWRAVFLQVGVGFLERGFQPWRFCSGL